jgi:hypothetical protein
MTGGSVFRHPPRKGARIVGYRPLTGHLRDAEGRLILEYVYETRAGAEAGEPSLRVAVSDQPAPGKVEQTLLI